MKKRSLLARALGVVALFASIGVWAAGAAPASIALLAAAALAVQDGFEEPAAALPGQCLSWEPWRCALL
ncbi:hypothetical protein [Pyrodictium abyssi]|uniref:Uncharacterized protein n=1 Tax=Pyrodictium abyssi TaxID=54256 RepID=A0ABN6ZL28_9CREN|nr:hypothetical protein PABY_05080 [Pyrodictium abyssi]